MTMDKTFDAAEAEPRIAALWEAQGCFRAGANARPGAEPYCIMMPPPNVTGSLHMGHALNSTLQDILIRWKRMQGFDTLWQPGQDHAGIATQMVVERQLAAEGNVGRRDMGREKFIERVWAQKDQSGDTIITQLKRLGASCDWSRNAFTLGRTDEDQMSRAVLKVFVDLYNQGLIYRGKRLVNWDPHFETAISDLEVENIEVDGHMWWFKYPLAGGETYDYVEKDADGNVTLRETRDWIAIATTRPETMLGDGAVAVNPSDERYAPIVGKMVHLPLCDRLIPIIADDYPDPAFGSGAVKITGAHDFNDYAVAMRNGIALHPLMDARARMRADDAPDNMVPAKYRGSDRLIARKAVVADIDAQGLMLRVEAKTIMQPFGDRSKVVIEPYLTDQWFVDAKTLAEPALAAVRDGRTTFHPEAWAKTYFQWLENIEPWCISRQLWWGHQIPVWYDQDGAPYCAETEGQAQAMAPGRRLTRDPDVLDTWFSSALWPFSTLGWPHDTPELDRYHPTAVLSTAFDIIFFWVARMMMMGLKFTGEVPFKDVYIHALVRDEQGRKMSKSLGNIIDPLTLIDQYGADAVRFTLASMAAMGRDLKLDVSRVEGYRNFATKLWNAARFCEMNGCVPDAAFDPASAREPVNRWIVGETARLAAAMDAALGAYRFNDAASAAYAHVWGVFCDWYVELSKPLLQGDDGPAKDETRKAAAWALDRCLILLHPIMPFVTEALWGQIAARPKLLAHTDWPALPLELADAQADADIAWAVALIEGVRSVRAEMGLAPGAPLPLAAVAADAATRARLARVDALIRRLARLSDVALADAAPKGAVTLALEGATLCLSLQGVIDVAAEQARLAKALEKLDRERGGIAAKLDNPAFIEKARPDVVDKERARLAQLEQDGARLAAAAARLQALA